MKIKTIGNKKDILNYYRETKPIKQCKTQNFINDKEVEYFERIKWKAK
jgi:hypothetical protein